MADLSRDFWMRENGTGQQVAQLHDRYTMMMMIVACVAFISTFTLEHFVDAQSGSGVLAPLFLVEMQPLAAKCYFVFLMSAHDLIFHIIFLVRCGIQKMKMENGKVGQT
jgi:hypothetical protein